MEDNDKFQIKEYAAAVHQRNMLHKKLYEARTPRIGIFFFAKGKLFADPLPIRYGYYAKGHSDFNVADGIVIVTRQHVHFESSIARVVKQTSRAQKKLTGLLRGRVAYDRKKRKYIVMADKEILGHDNMKTEIVVEFCLPDQRTRFESMEEFNVEQ